MISAHRDLLIPFLAWLIPGVAAITLHECAHGWMALYFGDTTARDMGRLSLNPIRHVDPVGTVFLPAVLLLFHAPFVFGYAKPVPVNFNRLRNGRFATFAVALAGPLANLTMMLGWLAVARMLPGNMPHFVEHLLKEIALFGVAINLVLIVFNLLPIPPLDGGRVVGALLPPPVAKVYMKLERFGIALLLLLMLTGLFGRIFAPLLDFFFTHLGLI